MNSLLDCLTFDQHAEFVRKETTPHEDLPKTPLASSSGPLLATDLKVSGQPLHPENAGQIIKPRELVDIIEITPLNRAETILYNQLLAHAWNDIRARAVHKIRKSVLRGSHQSNDRLDEAFDKLMGAWAKIRARDPQTGEMATFRVHLLGTNKEEDKSDGYFTYTFPPDLLAIISQSNAWATIRSHIMYTLRSKYSIRLYEMIERRIGLTKQFEEFSIEDLRGLLGVPDGKLPRYADFNKHCIQPALGEVNQLTDFFVSIAAVKKGHTVEKLIMHWARKDPDGRRQAESERERSRVGRSARRQGTVEVITFD